MTLAVADLRALAEGFNPAPAKSWSLPGRAYTRPDYLAAEREAIFKRSWQVVCHEEKLKHPGDYLAFEIQGQPLILVRDRNGRLGAFYNVCKHRGHELLSGEGNTALITCPYHAWAYGLDGRLRSARRAEFIEDYDTSKVCLTAVRVEVFCHFVFVNLDPAAEALANLSGDLAAEVTHYAPDLGSLTLAHRETFTIKANWKIVIDNFLECYHCPVAHKAFVDLVDMEQYKVKTHGIYSSHMSRGKAAGNAAYDTSGACVQDHAVWWLWPNICLLRFPGAGNMMVLNVIPVAPDETFETYDFYFEDSVPNEKQLEAIAYLRDVLQREDIDIVESVQRGMSTPAFDRGRFVADPEGSGLSEHGVHHFHGLVIEAMARYADRLAGETS